MKKLLAAGGVLLIVLAILMLHELKGTTTVDAAPAATKAVADHPADTIAPTALPAAPAVVAAVDPDKPKKITTDSDAFQFEFDDVQPKRLMKAVAKCYTGGLNRVADRSAKMKLTFHDHIVNGEVTVTDVKMVESTLNNKALEQCMIEKVSAYHWHNDILPDWVQEDMLLIRPEMGMKKYLPENLNYEGGGPEFPGGKAKEPVRAERPAKD